LFIDEIWPADFYAAMRAHMLECKHGFATEDRPQDSAAFVNRRCNLFANEHEVALCIRAVFTDLEIMLALLRKFYINPSRELAQRLVIHQEFEYFFTQAGRFQNVHVDIPPKYLSFVFYVPTAPMAPEQAAANATILYDKNLHPHHCARFEANSLCIFAPHYY